MTSRNPARTRPGARPTLLLVALLAGSVACGSEAREAQRGESASATLPEPTGMLFTSDGDLYRHMGRDGRRVRLTANPVLDHFGTWSPDGARIAFFSLRDGNREIYVMGADGVDPLNLTRHPGEDLLPDWSPDGTRIAFFSTRGLVPGDLGPFPGGIYTMRPDGSGLRQVTGVPLDGPLGPSWSASGDSLYFGRTVQGQVDLFVISDDGSGERRLTSTPDISEYGVDASPDGEWLTFHAAGEAGATIDVMRTDGSERRSVIATPGNHFDPRFSPDGSWIAYVASVDGDEYDVMVVATQGGEPVPLVATEADERAPSWFPIPPS